MGRRRSILKANTTVTNVNSNETTFCEQDDTYFGPMNEGKRRRRVSFNNSTYVRPIARVGVQFLQPRENENSVGTTDDYQLPTRFKSAEENSEDFADFRTATGVHRQMTDITEASSIAASPFTSTKVTVNNSELLNQTSIGLPSAPLSQPIPSSDYSIVPLQPKLSLDSLKGGISNITLNSVRNAVSGYTQQNATQISELNFSNISNGLPDLNSSRYDYRDQTNLSNVRSGDFSNSTKASIDLLLCSDNNLAFKKGTAANDEPSFLAQDVDFENSIFKIASDGDVLSQNVADLQLRSKVYDDPQRDKENTTFFLANSVEEDDLGSQGGRNVAMSLVFSDDESMSPKVLSSSEIGSQSSPIEKEKKELTTVEVAGNLTALFEQEPDIPVLKTPETKKSKEQSLLGKSITCHKQFQNMNMKYSQSSNSSADLADVKMPALNQLNLNGAQLLRPKLGGPKNKSPIDRLRDSASKDIVERKLKRLQNQRSDSNFKQMRRQVIECAAVKPPNLEPIETEPRLKNIIDFEEQTNMTLAQPNVHTSITAEVSSLKSNSERMHKFAMRVDNLHSKFDRVWSFDTDKVMQRLQIIVEPTCVSDVINTGSSELETLFRQLNPRASEQIEDARNVRKRLEEARGELENAVKSVELGRTLPRQKFGKSFLSCRIFANRVELNYGKLLDVVLYWDKSTKNFVKMQASPISNQEISENRAKFLSLVIENLQRRKTAFQSHDICVVVRIVHTFLSGLLKES
ncbi:uncharacterized protein LOC142355339 [Convolutriloba macropyga]|uniref:uncharacterized protein LOC142355339 n=1 Tax=Convolutriloba macropyga TaxID=536237 RepID=UPI003F52512A